MSRPQDFRIAYADPGQPAPPMSKPMAQFDQSARAWLVAAEFPTNLGNSLITNIDRVAQATKHMNADELESYGYAEFAKLEKAYGEGLDDKLRAAGRMIEQLEAATPWGEKFIAFARDR